MVEKERNDIPKFKMLGLNALHANGIN